MSKDLTVSTIDRQNILNNRYALEKLEEHLALGGLLWRGEAVFTKPQVAELLDVDERTIDRYISSHGDELGKNGYAVLQGNNLKDFKELISDNDMNVVIKTVRLGVFSFRAVLNLSMLLTESERARFIRSRILDVVIDVMAERAGGHTKYINQRDADYLPAAFQEESYRKKFTSALGSFVENFPYKYPNFTDRIYQSIFHEKAHEYRKILKLHAKENVRDTMYTEILELISSYENGLAHAIEQRYNTLGRQLNYQELKEVFDTFEANPAFEPLVQAARTKMASRDMAFREALHHKLTAYIQSVPEGDFERFLGEKSKELEERIKETRDVFKRLKDR